MRLGTGGLCEVVGGFAVPRSFAQSVRWAAFSSSHRVGLLLASCLRDMFVEHLARDQLVIDRQLAGAPCRS